MYIITVTVTSVVFSTVLPTLPLLTSISTPVTSTVAISSVVPTHTHGDTINAVMLNGTLQALSPTTSSTTGPITLTTSTSTSSETTTLLWHKTTPGEWVGIVFAGIFFVGCVVALVWWRLKRKSVMGGRV
ncbi:hypothetical protein P154DRAFT_620121 [Amniculicola lignicola CBS 123094]|uniref:Mid2 domain-containing protein n=1 Tax=Amniculicola lignicola CBS 123094 TaxID=1392246 RepID=A0A6A5WHT5_9PLEO|nr:hypothetical protein P154DRAFT_620121 [Amniculicola lignicola CBS 123094]